MADVALSLTKRALEGTVSRVLVAIDEDTKLRAAAQQDLRFIVGEFQMMQSALKVAKNNKESTSNEMKKTWVRQLRELAFDVEDCVEFVIHMDTTSARVRWSWWWRVVPLPSRFIPPWARDLDRAVAQLQQLKARVEDVCGRSNRYNLLGGGDSDGSNTTLQPVPPEQLDSTAFPSTVDILRDLWKANAKQSSSFKCNLKYLVTDGPSNELRVISVWRSAGVDLEAADILNAAYSDPKICGEFKARARVKLMHPFNIQEFLKNLLHQLYVTSPQQNKPDEDLSPAGHASEVHHWLQKLLKKHKYLIILEDLSSPVEWGLIRSYLKDSLGNGSRIVISTQQLGIALSCTGESYRVLQLALLPNNDGYIYAFYKPPAIGMTELVEQLGHRRVISLWGDKGGDTTCLVREVCEAIRNSTAKFKGVTFEDFVWVHVPTSPFSFEGLCRRFPDYHHVNRGTDESYYFAELWRKKVCKSSYLFVIEGLQSTDDWDKLKDKGLVPQDTKSCIVIIANDEAVAKHCNKDGSRWKMDRKEKEEAAIIGPLFAQKVLEESSLLTAFITPDQQAGGHNMVHDIIEYRKDHSGVFAVWGATGVGKSALVRFLYYTVMAYSLKLTKAGKHALLCKDDIPLLVDRFEKFGWVDIPDGPFDLAEFSRRLLLDFNSFHPVEKEKTAVSLIRGDNPIQQCYEIMRLHRCLVVIDGLRSSCDWDTIKQAFWCHKHPQSYILVVTTEKSVAKHCVTRDNNIHERRTILNMRALDNNSAHMLFEKVQESSLLTEFIPPDLLAAGRDMVRDIIDYHEEEIWGVFAVWGATGVGKSALVKIMYDTVMGYSLKLMTADEHPLLCKDKIHTLVGRFQKFGWVDVPDPFDLAEFSRRLLLDLSSYDPEAKEKTTVGVIQDDNPIQQCYEIMRVHKCLVVIDGLRSKRDWDPIKQAFWCHRHPQSRILVITIEESVAEHCVTNKDNKIDEGTILLPMRALGNKSARKLFKKIVDKRQEQELGSKYMTEQKLKHAKHIVPKCGGLPKIIDAVAKSDHTFWDNINDDIVTKLKKGPEFGHLSGIFSWMHSYIDGSLDSVKPCIFYLSVFPANYEIRKAHLLRRWIAEGYCRDTTGCSAKKDAQRLIKDLNDRDIIQNIGSMPVYHVNGFFREYITSQQMADNLVFALERQCKPNSQRRVQHLSIMKDWEREKHVFQSIDVSWLRSLTVFGKWEPFLISDKMKRIRVLDLEGTSGVKDCCLEHIFEILLSLKFICLRGCKHITRLPKTLGGLRQLETLDVSNTSIVTLPWTIIKLQKIQCIQAGRMFLLDEVCTSAASAYGVVDTRSPAPLLPRQEQDDDARQNKKDGHRQPSGRTATREAEGSGGGLQGQHQHHKKRIEEMKKLGRWASRLSSRFPRHKINGGVEVPVGIVDMPALLTLGIVNISRGGGKAFLTMFKRKTTLPQLLKLSVCGINNENWKDLCDALSAHDHLESLSLGLDKDFMEDSCFNNPPKALKTLRLYGHIHRLPTWPWIKEQLEEFDIEAIISGQECMDLLVESLPRTGIPRRLCIKLTQQVRELEFKQNDVRGPQVLKIDCSSKLKVHFESGSIAEAVNVLIIHCSEGSDFRTISSNEESGLKHLYDLNTVWLKGYGEKADYLAHLKEQVDAHPRKPVFKFEELKSA